MSGCLAPEHSDPSEESELSELLEAETKEEKAFSEKVVSPEPAPRAPAFWETPLLRGILIGAGSLFVLFAIFWAGIFAGQTRGARGKDRVDQGRMGGHERRRG